MFLIITVAVLAFTMGFMTCSLFVMSKMSEEAAEKERKDLTK